jgi:hypothetical protein
MSIGLGVSAVYAKERDLPFWQINRKMIGIFRDFVERELTDHIGSGPVTDDSVGLQLHWSIIEEFSGARQHLPHQGYPIVGFHGLNFDIDIDITRPEQQLPGRRSDAANAGERGLVVSVKNQGCDDFSKGSLRFRLHHRLEQANAPLDHIGWGLKRRIFSEPSHQSLKFLL